VSTTILKGAEIFAEGTHNGITFTGDDIAKIVSSFETLGLSDRVPLKLSHDGPDARTSMESKYALGWVKRVWRDGSKLLADLEIPQKVADAIKNGYLRFVSVELLKGVQAGTRRIPWTLDAVALLGNEQPAVGDLLGLQALMTRTPLQFESRTTFSRTNGESGNMVDEQTQNAVKGIFTAMKLGEQILPAAESQFYKQFPNHYTVDDAIRWCENNPKPAHLKFGRTQGMSRTGGNDPASSGDAGQNLVTMAREIAAEKGIDLSTATPQQFDSCMVAAMRKDAATAQRYKSAILGGED
jgi:hypothetical protein